MITIANINYNKNYSKMDGIYAFKKGMDQVPLGKAQLVKDDLMQALNIKSRAAWLRRLKGQIDPKVSEIKAVETVFAKHCIKQIWGS